MLLLRERCNRSLHHHRTFQAHRSPMCMALQPTTFKQSVHLERLPETRIPRRSRRSSNLSQDVWRSAMNHRCWFCNAIPFEGGYTISFYKIIEPVCARCFNQLGDGYQRCVTYKEAEEALIRLKMFGEEP